MSCNNADNPQEKIDKLRTIGIKTSPLVNYLNSGEPTVLTVHVALPKSSTMITTEPSFDPIAINQIQVFPEEIQIDQNSIQYQEYNSLIHAQFEASINIPNERIVSGLGENFSGAQVKYAFNISDANSSETVIGVFLVAQSSDKENLNFTDISITEINPLDGQSFNGTEHDLVVNTNNPNAENIKYGWFTTEGRMSNRRSASPIWLIDTPGNHTLIATVRGKKSKSFDFKFIDVTVE